MEIFAVEPAVVVKGSGFMRVKKLLGFSRIYSDEFGFGTWESVLARSGPTARGWRDSHG